MKKFIILAYLLIFTAVYAQQSVVALDVIRPEFTTVTLDSTASSTIYYIYPPPAGPGSPYRTAISTTAPTSASAQAQNLEFDAKGALTISIIPDSVTADESDSLYAYVQTLIYDPNEAAWYASSNDTLYLVLDTPGTYTATSIDYLNWTSGSCYTADLGGDIMPGAGLAVTVGAYQNDTAGADVKLYVGFWWLR